MLKGSPGRFGNRSHPQPTGAGPPTTPFPPCLRHRVLLRPWHLHPAVPPTRTQIAPPSVQPPTPTRHRGLTWQPRRLSRSSALAERGTTSRGGLYPEPRRGGAGRSVRLRQARAHTGLHRAPSGRAAGQAAESEGEVCGIATRKRRMEPERSLRELPGNVARGGGNHARCGSSLRAGSCSAGLAGQTSGLPCALSQRGV